MNKQERDAIRARYRNLPGVVQKDIYALLNTLDKMEAERDLLAYWLHEEAGSSVCTWIAAAEIESAKRAGEAK
ncbi:MAG: hypothetical protein FWG52_10155 [Proteobacteria bacterium]|nr:hypothetical protein [Pseudomonadota bacterium]